LADPYLSHIQIARETMGAPKVVNTEGVLGVGESLLCGECEPAFSFREVLRDSETVEVMVAKVMLRDRVTLLGGPFEPKDRLFEVCRSSDLAIGVEIGRASCR